MKTLILTAALLIGTYTVAYAAACEERVVCDFKNCRKIIDCQ